MKFARVIAAAVALLLVATGCARRGNNQSVASEPGVLPEIESRVEEGTDELRSDVEDGMSKLEDDLLGSKEEDESLLEESIHDELSKADESMDDASMEESAAAAMSTDFSEIGALDGTMQDGFPGGPVDAQNRPGGPVSYQAKYEKYGAYFIIPDSEKIYLTFDEGYENGYTTRILDTLKEKKVKAVFFITYPYAQSEPALVKRMVDEGHTLGNHSTAHKVFPDMPLSEAADDIMKLHNYVKAQFGYEMFLFRPPEGKFSEQTLAMAQSLGYKTILWSFAYRDWDPKDQPLTIEATTTILGKAHPGEICLLHAVSKTNTEILGDVIDQMREKGFTFADYFYFT